MGLFKKIFKKKSALAEDQARAFGTSVGELVEAAWEIDSNRDQNVSGAEIFEFVSVLASEAIKNFGTVGDALKQIKTGPGRDAFKEGFVAGFDLVDDIKEDAVEEWLNLIDHFFDTLSKTRTAFAANPAA